MIFLVLKSVNIIISKAEKERRPTERSVCSISLAERECGDCQWCPNNNIMNNPYEKLDHKIAEKIETDIHCDYLNIELLLGAIYFIYLKSFCGPYSLNYMALIIWSIWTI